MSCLLHWWIHVSETARNSSKFWVSELSRVCSLRFLACICVSLYWFSWYCLVSLIRDVIITGSIFHKGMNRRLSSGLLLFFKVKLKILVFLNFIHQVWKVVIVIQNFSINSWNLSSWIQINLSYYSISVSINHIPFLVNQIPFWIYQVAITVSKLSILPSFHNRSSVLISVYISDNPIDIKLNVREYLGRFSIKIQIFEWPNNFP